MSRKISDIADRERPLHRLLPVYGFTTPLDALATLTFNEVSLPKAAATELATATASNRLQARAFELLGVNPGRLVSIRVTG